MEKENETKKNYIKEFYIKHPEKLTQTFICDLCSGKYKYCNKNHHNNTIKHKNALRIIEKYANMA